MPENKRLKLIHRFKSDCSTNHFWESYKDIFKSEERKVPVSRQVYKAIIREYNERVMKEVIEDGKAFKLPFSLGYIAVVKRPSLIRLHLNKDSKIMLRPDFGHYNKTGEFKYHLNEHTNYYYYSFKWIRPTNTVNVAYQFKPAFHAKQKLGKAILENGMDYKLFRFYGSGVHKMKEL